MRSVFSKNAKRDFTVVQFFFLIAVLFSMFLPRSGFTFDGAKQKELTLKTHGHGGPNGSALWVTNLGNANTKLTVSNKPFDSVAQERSYASEVAAGKTVRLDDALPATFRGSDTLFIRSQEEVATLVAPVDFPVHHSEFYSSPLPQEDGKPQASNVQETPKWARELGGIGKTLANVFNADDVGYAPAVKGQREVDKRYVFGVGVALRKPNSSAELTLIDRTGQTIKSLVLSSSARVYWQAPLGEFVSGTDKFPSRIEMKVLTGTAQGFLSIKDVESGETTPLPIAPLVGESNFNAQPGDEESSLSAQSGKGGPMLNEESSLAPQGGSGGYAYFSNGIYDNRYSSYTFNVYSAPPNVCGTLQIVRNSNPESSGGWICTDAYGYGSKGPWTPSVNQTGENIRIVWPNGTYTVGGDYKVDDVTDPQIYSYQSGGVGIPIPTDFDGWGSDAQWGTGFNFYAWSWVKATFKNVSTNKYSGGGAYNSNWPVDVWGTGTGFSPYYINWSVPPPPPSAHNSYDTYEWCVYSKDYFYSCFQCIYLYGPR